MNGFHIRTDKATPVHTSLTLFANGANCGYLVFRTNEAEAFINCLQRGCESLVVDFHHTPLVPPQATRS